jgi:hypothetical protein
MPRISRAEGAINPLCVLLFLRVKEGVPTSGAADMDHWRHATCVSFVKFARFVVYRTSAPLCRMREPNVEPDSAISGHPDSAIVADALSHPAVARAGNRQFGRMKWQV